jgi:hypothetical protein
MSNVTRTLASFTVEEPGLEDNMVRVMVVAGAVVVTSDRPLPGTRFNDHVTLEGGTCVHRFATLDGAMAWAMERSGWNPAELAAVATRAEEPMEV